MVKLYLSLPIQWNFNKNSFTHFYSGFDNAEINVGTLGGCGLEAQAYADSLDGKTGDWNLPLAPGSLEPDWGW